MNLQNLLFSVSLLDRLSGPARGMMNTMSDVTTRIQGGFNKIGYGAAGLAGAGYALDSILQPAKEMQTALGEISSMNVGQQVLDDLNKTALKFSVQYGESAADFVRSAYDIQGAISGLSGNELPAFTNASAILAKGTKADMGTITNYVGTMYGIFQKNADAMGKANWINMMAGQTAVAVNIFKTTGQGMSEAFTTLGAGAQTMGVGMAEQMAIMGTLQATMSGSEAGTKYRAFLDGVGNAQDKLGLKFTDSQGKMLPMIDILTRIKGKFGDIDTVAESDLLKKAFGTQEATALVKLLSTNIGGLSNSINEVGKQTGLQGAIDMANAMVQPWERSSKAVDALIIMLGQNMLPLLKPVFDGVSDIAGTLMRWVNLFPNIAKWIGIATLGIFGIIGALSALSIVVGVGMVVMSGFGLAWTALKVVMLPFSPILTALRMGWLMTFMQMRAGAGIMAAMRIGFLSMLTQLKINIMSMKIYRLGVWLTNQVMVAAAFTTRLLGGAFAWMKTAILSALPAIWGFTVALLSNPITWLVLGIGALIGLVAAAVIYWDTWTQAVINWASSWLEATGVFAWVDSVVAFFERIPQWWTNFKSWISTLNAFELVSSGIDWVLEKLNILKQWWTNFKSWISTLNAFELVSSGIDWVLEKLNILKQWWESFKAWLSSLDPFAIIGQGLNALLGMLNKIPGVNIDMGATANPIPGTSAPTVNQSIPGTVSPSLSELAKPVAAPSAISQTATTPRGGIMGQITNANNSKKIDVGGINIYNPAQPVTGQMLADQIALAAG